MGCRKKILHFTSLTDFCFFMRRRRCLGITGRGAEENGFKNLKCVAILFRRKTIADR